MTLKLNRVRALVRYVFMQNFVELSAAVNELFWVQRKKNSAENITVRRYRADSNEAKCC